MENEIVRLGKQVARGPRGRTSKTQCQRCGHHNGKHSDDCAMFPKTVEEIAWGIQKEIGFCCWDKKAEKIIAAALTAYGEAEYRRGVEESDKAWKQVFEDMKLQRGTGSGE